MLPSFNVSKKAEIIARFLATRQGSVFLEAARQISCLFPFCFISVVFLVGPFPPVNSRTTVNSSTDAAKTLNPFSLRGDSAHVRPPSLAKRAIFAIGLN